MCIINIYIYIYHSEVPVTTIYLLLSVLAPCHASFSFCRVAADLLISTRLETQSHRSYIGCNCIIMTILLKYKSELFYDLLLRFQINHVCSEFRPMPHLCSYGGLYIFSFEVRFHISLCYFLKENIASLQFPTLTLSALPLLLLVRYTKIRPNS